MESDQEFPDDAGSGLYLSEEAGLPGLTLQVDPLSPQRGAPIDASLGYRLKQ